MSNPTRRVEAIFLAPTAGAPMVEVEAVRAVAGRGLQGDRYTNQRGHWSDDPCEVTLIAAEALEEATAQTGLQLHEGQHRRNLVTRGLDLTPDGDTLLFVGDVQLRLRKARPPCAYLDRLTRADLRTALTGRAGVCAEIVTSGRIQSGAEITLAGSGIER
jgi:MOSC domain-containing protein YiiM